MFYRPCAGTGDGNWSFRGNTYGWIQRFVGVYTFGSLFLPFCTESWVSVVCFITEIHSGESGLNTSNQCFQVTLSPQVCDK